MITAVLPMHPDGFAFDLSCPVMLCDHCHRPIDVAHPGNVLYDPERHGVTYHAHKGACDRALDPGYRMDCAEADSWLSQLTHNFANPLADAELTDSHGRTFRVREIKVRS